MFENEIFSRIPMQYHLYMVYSINGKKKNNVLIK